MPATLLKDLKDVENDESLLRDYVRGVYTLTPDKCVKWRDSREVTNITLSSRQLRKFAHAYRQAGARTLLVHTRGGPFAMGE